MKKVIFAALLFASAATLSSFTVKNDTAAIKHVVSDKKELGTVDDKKELGTVDDKKELGTVDSHKRNAVNDKKELGTVD